MRYNIVRRIEKEIDFAEIQLKSLGYSFKSIFVFTLILYYSLVTSSKYLYLLLDNNVAYIADAQLLSCWYYWTFAVIIMGLLDRCRY